ncbi:mycothiol transferase [Arthrobacter sp. TMN-50]
MSSIDILKEAFGRIPDTVRRAVRGLDVDQLAFRPGGTDGRQGNSVGWLIWHLARVQDSHLADAARVPELWISSGWSERFDLNLDNSDTGYGHTSAQVDEVRPSSLQLLVDYYDAVHARTIEYVAGLDETDLDRIVDTSWDLPVTLLVRLVSVIEDCLQHAGQAAYVRGMLIQGNN